MGKNIALKCLNVTKEFFYNHQRKTSLRECFVQFLKGVSHRPAPIFVLKNLTLEVSKGESVALLGPNGSGKSTALRLMAGIYQPSAGTIHTQGRVAAVIELGAGFNAELTGTENILLYGAIMGLTRKQIARQFDEIVQFAGVGGVIDIPVKYFSAGMYARLAFSIALSVNPDLLLIDEVLAVGDEVFRKKCMARLRDFLAGGGTLITASHDLAAIRTLCARTLWLERGQVVMEGKTEDIIEAYQASVR